MSEILFQFGLKLLCELVSGASQRLKMGLRSGLWPGQSMQWKIIPHVGLLDNSFVRRTPQSRCCHCQLCTMSLPSEKRGNDYPVVGKSPVNNVVLSSCWLINAHLLLNLPVVLIRYSDKGLNHHIQACTVVMAWWHRCAKSLCVLDILLWCAHQLWNMVKLNASEHVTFFSHSFSLICMQSRNLEPFLTIHKM